MRTDRLSWREFVLRVEGLLSANTRLARHFAPPPDDDSPAKQPIDI